MVGPAANRRTSAQAEPALLAAAIWTQSLTQELSVELVTDTGYQRFLNSVLNSINICRVNMC